MAPSDTPGDALTISRGQTTYGALPSLLPATTLLPSFSSLKIESPRRVALPPRCHRGVREPSTNKNLGSVATASC
ncbi:hypothetical protein E2C01_044093 [Portunus trituberculatus]|uniref:Uncharacterized protein n=1 Tax=Portunus trituberculatus TaxID=210409 RepID=A0A5B7FR59_PORTR|nr:hypothetical protein [Portunus trituberculatus]